MERGTSDHLTAHFLSFLQNSFRGLSRREDRIIADLVVVLASAVVTRRQATFFVAFQSGLTESVYRSERSILSEGESSEKHTARRETACEFVRRGACGARDTL